MALLVALKNANAQEDGRIVAQLMITFEWSDW